MRIVSLCPSLTELAFDLGDPVEVVGCTKFCVHPSPRVANVAKVGGTKDPNVERIIALRPDLVLMNEEENRVEDAETLEAAGIRCHVSFPKSPADASEMVRSIAAEVGASARGAQIASEIDTRLDELRSQSSSSASITFVYLIWRKPWMAVGRDTFISQTLESAGARNALVGEERYPTLTTEQLAELDADVLMLSSEPFPFKDKHRSELLAATQLDAGRVVFVDGELLSWHGSRTSLGLRYAGELMTELARNRA